MACEWLHGDKQKGRKRAESVTKLQELPKELIRKWLTEKRKGSLLGVLYSTAILLKIFGFTKVTDKQK